MTEIDPDLDDFVKYGKFPPGHENKKCIFECVFKTADLVDSNFVPSRKKIFDAFVRETGTGNANSARGGELLDLIEKCLPAPQDLPSPCNIISNFVLCFFDIMRVIDVKSIPPAIEQCSPKFNVSKNDPDLEHLFKNGEFPPGKETKKCFFECVLRNVDIVDSNFVPNEKKVMVFLERINSAGHLNSTQMAEFSDLVGKICLPPKDLSISYFWKNGEFPPGKENLNCYFECVFKAADIVDSNFMPTKNKLNELVEREKKEYPNAIFNEFIATDIVLEKCLPPKDISSPCNIATNFISCLVDIRNILNISELILKYGSETDLRLRSDDLKISKAEILGNSEIFVKSGSDINLTCVVVQSPEPPSFIYWYRNDNVINYSSRGGINVLTEKQTKTSRLLISRAQPPDSGNYTCSPSSSEPASVIVHVLNGEHPAAMQHGNSSTSGVSKLLPIMLLLICQITKVLLLQESEVFRCILSR
ncbi:hypothetical protein V9T40_011190 [Parthenolecanium corni]|uniref:Ig-like domain-containing protein n=1 Tax=Parthenolecanium corni TaxID=536013 RepID=A0AAN9T8I2_9HEMI